MSTRDYFIDLTGLSVIVVVALIAARAVYRALVAWRDRL